MIEPDEDDSPPTEFETVIVPGRATGPIPERNRPSDPPIVVGIPAVKVHGKLYSRGMIARGTGIGISHISKILKGTRSPSLQNAIKLAAYFGVTTEFLLTNILPNKQVRVQGAKSTAGRVKP